MTPLSRTLALLAAIAPLAQVTPVLAQSRTAACGLLTAAEVRKLTGNKDYPDFADGEVRDDGRTSTCQYGGMGMGPGPDAPLLSVVLQSRKPGSKNAAEFQRTWKLGAGCKRENVTGVGDDAVYESCPDRRGPILYATKGSHDLLVQLDAKPATDATKATVIAVAKAAAAKIK
jgi:hypothetical protein